MALGIVTRGRSELEKLRWLAIVFRVDIRHRIVAELHRRAMSPRDFQREFDGGSVSAISKHFEVLVEHRWLRRVGPKPTGMGGHVETLYRAPEPPYFEAGSWAVLPYSLRLAWSAAIVRATERELRVGIERAILDGRPSRDLSCVQLILDALGWEIAIRALDSRFETVFEVQDDAKVRVERSGRELKKMAVLHAGFESPWEGRPTALARALAPVENRRVPLMSVTERMAPLLADPLSMGILDVLNRDAMSIKGFHRQFAGEESEWVVRHRFGRLKKLAWATVVEEVQRRAVHEHIYRATRPAILDREPWDDVPKAILETEIWATFERFSALVDEAVSAGSFDLRDDRHLTWSIVSVDREGWDIIVGEMEDLQALLRDIEASARKRIDAGARPLTMTVALAAVEAPSGILMAP